MSSPSSPSAAEPRPQPLELLAPAGSLEVFQAAVESGADAVYIGAPSANARALARHFTLEEIAAMREYASRHGVKLYVAMNSLVKDGELPEVVRLLSVLSGLGIDAVIVQDLGVYHLARHYFPELRLHASTLLGAHNSVHVRQFADMGFARVVLARELTIPEIAVAAASSSAEIEVFIHGAMCFAYSGLCLFSSFLGGKSGLRGRCVQPCRRKYTWQGKGAKGSGYLFSMNDLQGLGLIGDLQRAGVRSLKIEGRMRSRQYVSAVVRAYRLVIDAPEDADAVREAEALLATAMGRKSATGYFLPTFNDTLITHQYSGNIGLFLGKLGKCRQGRAELALREPLFVGDRIRVHNERSGERDSLTVREIWHEGRVVEQAAAGQMVRIGVPDGGGGGDPVYKVDSTDSRQAAAQADAIQPQQFRKRVAMERQRERIRRIIASLTRPGKGRGQAAAQAASPSRPQARKRGQGGEVKSLALPWWLRVDDLALLAQLPAHNAPERLVVLLTRETIRQFRRISVAGEMRRRLIWGLPPVIVEGDLEWYRQAIGDLGCQGFLDWQVGHIGQALLVRQALAGREGDSGQEKGRGRKKTALPRRGRLTLHGHYSLNVMNAHTLHTLAEAGIASAQVAIEADREMITAVAEGKPGRLGLTVFAYPPLFTARSSPGFFQFDQRFVSPKGEGFVLKRAFGQTLAVPILPFSLLDRLAEIKAAGVDYVVVDLTSNLCKRGDLPLLWRRLEGWQGHEQRLSSFNYRGSLQ